jgi:hypothetical protein
MVANRTPKSTRFGKKPVHFYRNAPGAEQSSKEVRDAWFRAKAANPSLTQRQFEREAMGVENPTGRYLRLVLEGKRSGRLIVREQTAVQPGGARGLFQLVIRDKSGNVIGSRNVIGGGTTTGLDAPLVHQRLSQQGELQAILDEFARRYSVQPDDIDEDDFEVRKITTYRRPAIRVRVR